MSQQQFRLCLFFIFSDERWVNCKFAQFCVASIWRVNAKLHAANSQWPNAIESTAKIGLLFTKLESIEFDLRFI